MDQLGDSPPILANEIPQRQKGRRPAQAARPRKKHEISEGEIGCAGDYSGQMANSRDVVAAEQRPVTAALEPAMDAVQALLIHVEIAPEAVHHAESQGPADPVAQADAAPTA